MDNVRLTFLFYRYVNKTCSETERKELLELLSDPRNRVQVKALMGELWNDLPHQKLSPETAEAIVQKILLQEQTEIPFRQVPSFQRIAAVILVTVLSMGAIYYITSRTASPHYALQTNNPDASLPRFIKLSDGSTVILNAASRLDYPESFAGDVREVSLEGEGYFDIVPDASKQFVVHTGKIKTTVLGTAFNVQAYPDQTNITVTVKRGKVQVSNDKRVMGVINSNQQITFNMHEQIAAQATVDAGQATAWMEKDIFFDDITLGHAIDQLEKRFDVSISVE